MLASRHSAIPTRSALRRVGIHYELFDVPFSVKDSLAQIRRIAALAGNAAAGEVLVSKIQRAIDAARRLPPGAPRLTAAVYETGGLIRREHRHGRSDADRRADNLAARYDIQTHQPMQLSVSCGAA